MSGPAMGEHVMKSKTFKIVRRAAEDMAACLDCLMTALSADDYEAVDFSCTGSALMFALSGTPYQKGR